MCTECEGSGCGECDGGGRVLIVGCPHSHLDEPALEAVRIAGFWEKGIPPVAGGYLDQTASIIDAAALVWSDQAAWKKRLGLIDMGG